MSVPIETLLRRFRRQAAALASDAETAAEAASAPLVHTHVLNDFTTLADASHNLGTVTTGTVTPDTANGIFQRAINGGAHTLAPPSTGSSDSVRMFIQYTNNASAGVITTSGFTKVDGAFTTTDGDDFMAECTVINGFSLLKITALQ